ncbi:MAG: hypothetical protein MUE73_09385 [Planctomycetes bacterium]|nr:hypothetical protein [Planctomycetota bacterium]
MVPLHFTAKPERRTRERRPTSLSVRTYGQIAEILAEREGRAPMTQERVRQLCQEAEQKIARALLADPEFGEILESRLRMSRELRARESASREPDRGACSPAASRASVNF